MAHGRCGGSWAILSLLAALTSVGCDSNSPSKPARDAPKPTAVAQRSANRAAAPATTATVEVPEVVTQAPAVDRIVAIGDVHGDLAATRQALKLGGLIDDADHWAGGTTTFVQTGDILDRGDDEQAIIELFDRMKAEARAAGGAVHILNGNHELMNAMGDFRYVTPGGMRDFADAPGVNLNHPMIGRFPANMQHRAAAFLPGGPYAIKFASHPVVLIVGDNVFVHGGVLPEHARYGIDRINRETSTWLVGGDPAGQRVVTEPQSVVWSRHYSDDPDEADCQLLADTLTALKAKRMIVGHTPQPGIQPACNGRAWLIDCGMAKAYPGKPAALEIKGDSLTVLK